MPDPIVAIGFLTANDLERLGNGFGRAFPVQHDDAFDDLLRRLDEIDVEVDAADHSITISRPN